MGIFNSYLENKKKKLLKAEGSYEYDQMTTPDRYDKLRDRFTRTMLVNSVWYAGDDIQLKKLYEDDLKRFKIGRFNTDALNYFWAQPTDGMNIRKLHAGIPQLISEKMVDLLLSNGYDWSIQKGEERDDINEARLNDILVDVDFHNKLTEAIESESWAGGVAFKISIVEGYTYPILEVIQADEYEPIIKYGKIVGDVFITYLTVDNILYKLKEYYGVDENGAYIRNEVFKYIGDNWVTAKTKDIASTLKVQDAVFPTIKQKLSLYKPNKLPNSEFRGSQLGESDYSGSQGMFDAIDEIVSTVPQELRDAKIKNFWPAEMLPFDPMTKEQYIPKALKKDFITYKGGIGEKEKPVKPELTQGKINAEQYIEALKKYLEIVLNNAGLSPQTSGITGLESTAASEESQELREKTSIRTREKKIGLWQPTLQKLFNLLLVAQDYIDDNTIVDYDIEVLFADYKIETLQDKTATASAGIIGKTWDIKTAVNYVHPELTDDEKTLMVVNIKIENGITAFTKEEEIIFKKYMAEVEEQETDIVDEQTQEPIEEFQDNEVDVE